MNGEIPIEKIFEMYGRISFERDLMREQLQQINNQQRENKQNDKHEDQ